MKKIKYLDKDIKQIPLVRLHARLKRNLYEIKKLYKKTIYSHPDSFNEQVLFDNYYIIEKITKILLKSNKKDLISVNKNYQPLIGKLILEICNSNELPNENDLISAITLFSSHRTITNTEFELIIWQFRYVLIQTFTDVYLSDIKSGYSPLDLIILISKSDTIMLRRIINECNPIEKLYSSEACGVYTTMDYNTKSKYRYNTSEIAKKTNKTEIEVAKAFLSKANAQYKNNNEREGHVGYYIYNEYNKLFPRVSPSIYLIIIASLTIILSFATTLILESYWLWLLLLIPFYEISRVIIEKIIARNVPITYLPRLEIDNKIPNDAKTLAVYSAMITSAKDIYLLQEKLISLNYTNISENMRICALCDLKQADFYSISEDKALIRNTKRIIKKMNDKYNDRFYLIIRNRTYSKTQRKYTGYERKRGAIEQLVRFIKNENVAFAAFEGDESFIHEIKYIVTLDSDTKPLMDTIPELVAIALHPLNKPVIENGRVAIGYGIITPKISTSLKSSLETPFSKLVGGIGSSCAYDISSANLYQDIFDEGIFSGKGLMDINTFYNLCIDIFPSEQVLSHDILEGELMRTAFAGDVEFQDNFPSSIVSYYKRLHRWIRGDIQNISFISSKINSKNETIQNPYTMLSRFKLLDNIKRALFPVVILLAFLIAVTLDKTAGFYLTLFGMISIIFPYIVAFISSVIYDGIFNISRKYYSNVISHTTELLTKAIFSIILLPQNAIISADATIRAIWRKYVSHKKLLEWTTAAQTDKSSTSLLSFTQIYLFPVFIGITLLFANNDLSKVYGITLVLSLLIIRYSDIPYRYRAPIINESKRSEISTQLAAMWQFYEDYATEAEHYLPPDNVQFAPVFRICHRTSPTNIGLMLLSTLVARDFELIDTSGLYKRIDRTISTIELLDKYKGNLYNWYNTNDFKISNNPFVSSVDSGNFVCSLVALKEGLKEYATSKCNFKSLIARIEAIIDNTEIYDFYDNDKGLLSIGYNPETKQYSPNHYDLLMSEARMTSYFAIAKRQIPKAHWKHLGRTMSRQGLYSGPVSYSGTMFEYFMPELLLSSENGSLSYEGLRYCLNCQKKRGRDNNVPFGISESGYFAFDNELNYQYKAHGVQKTGLKRGLDNELVVSPYSTYLVLEYDFNSSFQNLEKLKKYGMYGNYGFYEAIDFTSSRGLSSGSIIKSYMAHHVGMSIVSISNALQKKRIKKRFLQDKNMKNTDELLQEKIMSGAVVFEDIYKKPETQRVKTKESEKQYFEKIQPSQQNVKLLCNGEYTLILTDAGISIAMYQGRDVYQRTTDVLRRPEGCYFSVSEDDKHYCLTYLPEYVNYDEMSVEFDDNTVSYFRNTNNLQIGMKVHLHNSLPCEIRQFAIKNTSSESKNINLLSYIQPVLSNFADNAAHPAFSKLFLKVIYDIELKIIIVSRKNRHNDDTVYCAVGFVEDISLDCNLSREEILPVATSVSSVFDNKDNFIPNYNSIPDPTIFIKTNILLAPNEQKELNLFIITALTKDDLLANISQLRYSNVIYTIPSSLTLPSSIEGRLVNSILPQILFKKYDCKEIIKAIENNKLPLSSLWGLSISGDLPLVLINVNNVNVTERITGYVRCHNILKLCGIKFDLVFTFNDKGEYERSIYNMLTDVISSENMTGSVSTPGGIHLIDIYKVDKDVVNLLNAVAVHVAPLSMVRIYPPLPDFLPVKFLPMEKQEINIESPLQNGGFNKDSYVINKETCVPWCNILANPVFGTLLSNNSLGYTYAINSRENKLTPWENDTRTDNRGEMLIVKINNEYYDVVYGSTVEFSPENAVYYGECKYFRSKVTVSVSQRGMAKKISLELDWKVKNTKAKIAYYTEPVLAVSRDNSRMIVFSYEDDILFANNPLNKDIQGYMSIHSSKKPANHITNREVFLKGKWDENSIASSNYPCSAVIINTKQKDNANNIYDFYLCFGATKESSKCMQNLFRPFNYETTNQIHLQTPDFNLNNIFNTWLNWQALGGRIYARTGFYQNSGAWGFRDQLQDSCGCLLTKPEITKQQIARACTAQFPEGDVLHWWHKLPKGIMRGVRTKYSDDLVWLPYTVCEYIDKTSDTNILGINIAYCKGITLGEGQHEIYGEVHRTSLVESVYTHCKKALDYAFKLGEHNLILMGCGDWNDSFNGVGIKGKGESVWLSEFMIIVLKRFAIIAKKVNDINTHDDYIEKADILTKAIRDNCWDGEWYIRAYFDNGDELGSKDCEACQIDSLAQSFAVLSDLPDQERNRIALNSAYSYLVDKKYNLIKLFTPAFQKNEMPVGYATAYPRGIRENGGQYTHGAIWLAIALMQSGMIEKGVKAINLLNPANKYLDESSANIFKNEPYFMTADIYTNPQCYGRGGWSIYTGAAAWYYRAIFEWFVGIKIKDKSVSFNSCLPDEWDEYEVNMNYNKTQFHIIITRGHHSGQFDNDEPFERIPLDSKQHEVRIVIARKTHEE